MFVRFALYLCGRSRRWIDVCFQPWHNPLWLTGLKAPTNSMLDTIALTPGYWTVFLLDTIPLFTELSFYVYCTLFPYLLNCPFMFTGHYSLVYWTVLLCLPDTIPLFTELSFNVYWTLFPCLLNCPTMFTGHYSLVYWTVLLCLLDTIPLFTELSFYVYWTLFLCLQKCLFMFTERSHSMFMFTGHYSLVNWTVFSCSLDTIPMFTVFLCLLDTVPLLTELSSCLLDTIPMFTEPSFYVYWTQGVCWAVSPILPDTVFTGHLFLFHWTLLSFFFFFYR